MLIILDITTLVSGGGEGVSDNAAGVAVWYKNGVH